MSEWTGNPRAATWYGEVVFGSGWGLIGTETDYNYGYSHSVEKPEYSSLDELVPDGYRVYERVILKADDLGE